VEWAADAIATSKRGTTVASIAARRLARKRAIEQKERFAPVYQAMRVAFGKGDLAEFHRLGRVLDRMGRVRPPSTVARREALFAKLASLCSEYR